MNQDRIHTRFPNEECGGFFKFPAFLIGDDLAIAVFERNIEVHIVQPTETPGEYDLVYASNPLFIVGEDWQSALEDARTMTFSDFAKKYRHPDFIGNERCV